MVVQAPNIVNDESLRRQATARRLRLFLLLQENRIKAKKQEGLFFIGFSTQSDTDIVYFLVSSEASESTRISKALQLWMAMASQK